MDCRNVLRAIAFLFLLAAAPVHAGSVTLPSFNIERTIKGIAVVIPVTTTASRDGNGPVRFSAVFALADLFAKTDAIVRASGVDRDERCGTKLTYNGTQFAILAGQVSAKAHFNGGRQICKKIVGIPSSVTARSNGSVTVPFGLSVQGNRISLTHGAPVLAVSNDIVRAILDATKLDEKIQAAMTEALDKALSDPKAAFQLPPAVLALGVTVETAQFEQRGSTPAVVVQGTLPTAAAVLLQL